jgi:hypothetical protein
MGGIAKNLLNIFSSTALADSGIDGMVKEDCSNSWKYAGGRGNVSMKFSLLDMPECVLSLGLI